MTTPTEVREARDRRALAIVQEVGWERAVIPDPGRTVLKLEANNPYYNAAFIAAVCEGMRQRLLTAFLDPLSPLEQFCLDALLEHIAAIH
jgi:hypothetical protein